MNSPQTFGKIMKPLLITFASIALFAFLAYVPDPLLLLILTVGGGLWIGVPSIACGLGILLTRAIQKKSLKSIWLFLGSVILFFSICGMAMPVNSSLNHYAELAAKAYPEEIRPLLESYKASHGAYPKSLDQLSGKPSLPRLLRKSWSYRSDGKTYSFSFPKPGGLIDVWDYDSKTRRWHLST